MNRAQVSIFKQGKHRFGVAISSGKSGMWPKVVNVARDGLAKGRLLVGDRLISINGVEMCSERDACRMMRKTYGLIVIRLYREGGRDAPSITTAAWSSTEGVNCVQSDQNLDGFDEEGGVIWDVDQEHSLNTDLQPGPGAVLDPTYTAEED